MSRWFVAAIAIPNCLLFENTFIVEMRETNEGCRMNGLTVFVGCTVYPGELILLCATLNDL